MEQKKQSSYRYGDRAEQGSMAAMAGGRAVLGCKESVSFQTSSCHGGMDPGNEKRPPADGDIIIKRYMESLASTTPLNSRREGSSNLPPQIYKHSRASLHFLFI